MTEPPATGTGPAADALLALAPAVYRTARRLTHRLDDAASVTIRTIAAASCDHAGGGAEPSRARVFAALWVALQELWQHRGYRPQEPPQSPEAILDARLGSDEAELDALMMSRLDASPDVDVALRQAGERERFAVLLVDVEDVTVDEAATAMGTDPPTLCRWLLAGRARIFASLADYAQRASGLEAPG